MTEQQGSPRERRGINLDDAEIRATGSNLTFTGYASVFDYEYPIVDARGAYTEVIRPGAFKRSLELGADVPFLVNHDGTPLARTKSGTMELVEDKRGLQVTAHLDPANPKVQEVRSAMSRGDLDEMSFGFRIPDGGQVWTERSDDRLREIREANIHKGDVSVVNYGSSDATAGASLRGLVSEWRAEDRRAILSAILAADPAFLAELRDHVDGKDLREVAAEAAAGDVEAIDTAVREATDAEVVETLRSVAEFEAIAHALDSDAARLLRKYGRGAA